MFSKENRITGFVYGEKEPMVIISDTLYRVGEEIAGYKIIKITRDTAYLKFGHRLDQFISGDLIISPLSLKQ